MWKLIILVCLAFGRFQPPLDGDTLWTFYLNISGSLNRGNITVNGIDAALQATISSGCRMFPTDTIGAQIFTVCNQDGDDVISRADLLPFPSPCNNTNIATLSTNLYKCMTTSS